MTMPTPHIFHAQVYYEDTDHSGVVYHANYLKYFERAREAIIGIDTLSDMWHHHGIGFAVYKADLRYHDGAVFGDLLEIRTRWEKQGEYRLVFFHEAWRPGGTRPAVTCTLDLVCLGPGKKLLPIPDLPPPQ
ncbi:MAG: YbgC/FadM family acyl-CoA thioesterase [Desulfotignum sp.]